MIKKGQNGWQVDIQPGGRGQRRIRKTFRTKAEAKRFESYVLGRSATGDPYQPAQRDDRRLTDLIDLWYDFHGVTLKDGQRRRSQLYALARLLGDPVASSITANDAARLRQLRLADGITPATVNHDHAYFRAVFNTLARIDQWNRDNPFVGIKPLKTDETELTFLTSDQINRLLLTLDACPNPDAPLLARLCLATGARWSEAQYLRLERLQANRVTFVATKSGRSRTVPLDPALYRALVDHASAGRVFPTDCYYYLTVAIRKAGIVLPRGQRTHVLRHTFASHFIMNGGHLLTLQKILGHSTITMTLRYAHLSPDHLSEAVRYAPKLG